MMMDDLKALVQEFQTFDKNVAIEALRKKFNDDSFKELYNKLESFDVISENLKAIHSNWNGIAKVHVNDLQELFSDLTDLKPINDPKKPAFSVRHLHLLHEDLEKVSTKIVAELYNEVIAQVQIGDNTLGI
jgi:hypothetical protein